MSFGPFLFNTVVGKHEKKAKAKAMAKAMVKVVDKASPMKKGFGTAALFTTPRKPTTKSRNSLILPVNLMLKTPKRKGRPRKLLVQKAPVPVPVPEPKPELERTSTRAGRRVRVKTYYGC